MVKGLWPVHVRREVLQGRDLPAWEEADRGFVWMSALYGKVENSLDQVRQEERAIQAALEENRAVAAKARDALAAINNDKDALLGRRMSFKKNLAEVRKSKVGQEEELQELLSAHRRP